jgi:S-adenosylmethionine decarboxylase
MGGLVFFEGPEKKIEIIINKNGIDLRSLGDDFWDQVVEKSRAKILSSISNEWCTAYLLSESSLFVYSHALTMITCGQTTLVEAVKEILKKVPAEMVEVLIYERKDEIFPHRQPSSFFDDARELHSLIPGRALRFGTEDSHHVFVYTSERSYVPTSDDMTLEILMHNISNQAMSLFQNGEKEDLAKAVKAAGIWDILPGYQVDEHFFQPAGYSLNAIAKDRYNTLHVTPQQMGSYVSFETNHQFFPEDRPGSASIESSLKRLIERVMEIFEPRACSIVFFQGEKKLQLPKLIIPVWQKVEEPLVSGYNVQYQTHMVPDPEPVRAFQIPEVENDK